MALGGSKLPKEKARAKKISGEGRTNGENERGATSPVTTRHKDGHCARRNGPEAPKTKAPFLSGGRRRVAAHRYVSTKQYAEGTARDLNLHSLEMNARRNKRL